MLGFIKKNASKFSDELAGTNLFWFKSPSGILLFKGTNQLLKKIAKGKVLDIGAGRLAYKKMLLQYCDEYKSVDFRKTNDKLDYVADAQDMKKVIKDNQFDTVFCSQVLEHVPEPQKAINEMYRVLKKGGHAILSVPFLGYLHNEPHDFFRYTKHSLKFMGEKAGFEVLRIQESGGMFSFTGYIWSTLFVGFFSGFPIINKIIFYLNIPICYFWIFLDKLTKNSKIMPLNYLVILKKK
jgi:SAM-dependent methyltransferase